MANRKIIIPKTKVAKSLSFMKTGPVKQFSVAAALMFASANVHALGLGSLEIDSNLDQPLNGQIELRVNDGDDLNSVTAAIASELDFESLGVDYPEYLKDISLSLLNDGVDSVLMVSSNGVIIKEPFIHFLVRVEWSGGSFLREYTALIDPPVYAAESPQSSSDPKEVGTDQSYLFETPSADTEPSSDDEVLIGESLVEDGIYNNNEDASVASPESRSALSDARYGPVESGESLSLIASELRTQFPDLSIYQIMKVLFEENQSAFIGGNINGLIKGSILNIGDLSVIRAVDVEESRNFFISQVNEWNPASLSATVNVGQDNYRDSVDDYRVDSASGNSSENGRFQVGSSTEENNFISSDNGSSRDGEVLALRQEVSQLETTLASNELEKQELNERISLLEGQLSDMNRLVDLNLKNSEMAVMENTLKKNREEEAALENNMADEVSAIDEFLTPVDDGIDTLVDSSISIDEPVIEELVDDGELTDSVNESLEPTADVGADIKAAPKPAIVKEESIIDTVKSLLFGGGLWKILAGLGGLIAIGLGIIFIRNRRADEEFEISMLSIESNSQSINDSEGIHDPIGSVSMSQSVVSDDADAGDKETSFLTVYSDSDAVVQADEVDPVAEADVYIAYGRDEQAEEVLLDGVVSHPDRIDIKHKLLSLYYNGKNSEGFERIAEELYSQRDELSSEAWQQISQMGKEIAPHNPLFELEDIDLASVINAGADLQLNVGDNEDASSDLPVNDDDLVVDDSRRDGVTDTIEESDVLIEPLLDDDSIALVNLNDESDEGVVLASDDAEMLDFGDSDDSLVVVSEGEKEITIDIADLAFDDQDETLLEFDFDGDGSEENDYEEASEVSGLEIDPDYDEARTQYELAKVFVDLGDEDGARAILVELVASSDTSESVVVDSKALLDSISS